MVNKQHFRINKALGDGSDIASVGVNVHIPNSVWIGLGTAITVPAVLILLLVILKQKL